MSKYDPFDTGEYTTGIKGPEKPFWALDFSDEEALLTWLKIERDHLKNQAQERMMNQRKNLAMYRGIQYQSQSIATRDEAVDRTTPQGKRSKNPRVVYNHMFDMVEQDVARATKYRGAINATPPTDDNGARQTAKVAEQFIEQFWDKADFDHTIERHVRRKNIYSEDFFGVFWDQNLGPYDLDWVAAVFKEIGIKEDPKKISKGELRDIWRKRVKDVPRLPLLDPETNKQMTGRDGDLLWMDKPQRRGDVRYRLISSPDMFLQRKNNYEDAEYGMFHEFVHIDTVRAMHPSKASDINPDSAKAWDCDRLEEDDTSNKVEVWHFYHRSTAQLDQGRYVKWCQGAILKNRINPYLGWDDRAIFPWARTVDIETPEVINGDSKVTFGRPCQSVYNNLVSMRIRSHFLVAHPKWFFPANSVKQENLANGATLVSYKGPVPPTLSQPTVPPNDEPLLNRTKEDYQQIMGVYGVSRGEPPAGVTAAVALTFLDEQENERGNVGVSALTRTQRDVALMTLWLMADHYDNDRLDDLMGKSMDDAVQDFKVQDLRNISKLRINNASALPQQKSARVQYLLDIKKTWPGVIPDDMAVDLLDLGEMKRFQNIVSVAIRKADDENDLLSNGKKPDAPGVQEYHLAHYRIHIRQMNEPFYSKLTKAVKQNHMDHAAAHEMFLCDIIQVVPAFVQTVLQEFPGFPMFYKPGKQLVAAAAAPPPPADSAAQGGAPNPDQAAAMQQQAPQEQQPGGSEMLPNPGSEELQPINAGQDPGAGLAMPT